MFSAVLQGQTLPLETGLEAILNAEAISIEKTDAGHSLIMAWFEDEPDPEQLSAVVSRSVKRGQLIDQQIVCYKGRDWLAENRKAFPLFIWSVLDLWQPCDAGAACWQHAASG